ncbi:MAG: GTP-binding protein [Planctomycetes bacterium]|nr:GTP-binding protein [Planctomycetota bacterium]
MIALHVLTGFLGSGKTTLLSALLQDPKGERIAVLVNEVGELALDHHLLERIDEDILALPSGCICCTMRSELSEAVERILALKPDRIVIETTGLADPAPILHGLTSDPRFADLMHVAGVIAVVDASRIETLIDAHPEVRRQLDLADRIVLTKGDLVPDRVPLARDTLAVAAPGCAVREADSGRIDSGWLFAPAPLERIRDSGTAHAWLHHTHGESSFRTHSVQLPAAARIDLIQLWLRLVTQLDGHRLLRIKGLVECSETGDMFVLQSAEHALSPPRKLARVPAGVRGVQMVLIERGMPTEAMSQVIAALREAVSATPRIEPVRPES